MIIKIGNKFKKEHNFAYFYDSYMGFWKCCLFGFHFTVAFLIISPYVVKELLRDYNYDNNIMLNYTLYMNAGL